MSGSSMSDIAFSSERKNRPNPSRIHPLSRTSVPSSSRTHCDSTLLVPPQLQRFDVLEESILIFHAQMLLQPNDVALEEPNDCCISHSLQPVVCLSDGPSQLRIPGVHFRALPRCVHRISRSLQLSFGLGVSTLTSPWAPSFLGWDPQFSGPHDGCGECAFHVVHTAVSWRVYPEVTSNRCGRFLSELELLSAYGLLLAYVRSSTGGF